jgi:hypothetical protein
VGDSEDALNRRWPMRLLVGLIGSLFLGYGIWCLYTGQAYIVTKYTPLHRYQGLQADFIAWSDIAFSGVFFSVTFLYGKEKLMKQALTTAFILTLLLSFIGIVF